MEDNKKLSEIETRLASIEAQLAQLSAKRDSANIDSKLLDIEINRLLMGLGWVNNPQFYLACMPTKSFDLPSIFESQVSPVVTAFEHPESVRTEGFGFYSADQRSKLVDGKAREVVLSSQARRLTKDGKLSAVFHGGDDFLGWGMRSIGWAVPEENKGKPLGINALVLIEATYNFVHLALQIAEFSTNPHQVFLFQIGLNHMKNGGFGPQLLDGKADIQMHRRMRIPSDIELFKAKIEAGERESAGRITFRLVAELYHRFNLTDDKIPYSIVTDESREVDPSTF